MIKLFFYLPMHLLNGWISLLSPRWVLRIVYAPSDETIREQEQAARNKTRLAAYYTRKFLTKN